MMVLLDEDLQEGSCGKMARLMRVVTCNFVIGWMQVFAP